MRRVADRRLFARRNTRAPSRRRVVQVARRPDVVVAVELRDLRGPVAATAIDCLTMWLSNHLLADTPLEPLEADLLKALSICPAQLVLVTNEVGYSVVPENALARKFRTAQGQLNQKLAAAANKVVLVTAGLPLVLKNSDP